MNIEVAGPLAAGRVESELVERAQGGDLVSFELLLRGRIDRLFRLACGILNDPAEADDVTQEVCIAAWRKLGSLRDPGRLDAWLGRVLLNACRMRLRDRARIRQISLDAGGVGPLARQLVDEGGHVERMADVDRVVRALDRVSVDDRALLVMHHVERQRVGHIAEVLGIPAGTVKWRLSRARHAVQRALEDDE